MMMLPQHTSEAGQCGMLAASYMLQLANPWLQVRLLH
jgi:hypothetical protein